MHTKLGERLPRRRFTALLMAVLGMFAMFGMLGPALANASTTLTSQLSADGQLGTGDSIISPSGAYRLVMQTDGNLVEYGPRGPIWATYTYGPGARLVNQSDGNVVIYGPNFVWASGTNGKGPANLTVQDDGNVVAYGANGAEWTTYTDGGRSKMAAMGAISFASKLIGKPYVFGAAGPNAFDCSGLTMQAYASVGVSLLRTSQQQYTQGVPVSRAALQPGDLVFYNGGSPGHVGIYIGNGKIIDALGSKYGVRIDSIDFPGSYTGARRLS